MIPQKILLVDDDEDIRLVGAIALQRTSGWKVVEAASGREALCRIAEDRPDVVLLDVMMPDVDGPATLARIRSDPKTADLPVIFLTARAQKHEIESYLALGADGVIAKPFDVITLADEIRRIVDVSAKPDVREEDLLASIRESYRRRLPQLLAELGASLSGAPTRERIEAARELAHRLKGTTGSYGFDEVSAELAEIEARLDGLLGPSGGDAAASWHEIAAALRRVHAASTVPGSGGVSRGV